MKSKAWTSRYTVKKAITWNRESKTLGHSSRQAGAQIAMMKIEAIIQPSRFESVKEALEENRRRLKSRLVKLLAGADAPKRLTLATEWLRLDCGGTGQIIDWIESV